MPVVHKVYCWGTNKYGLNMVQIFYLDFEVEINNLKLLQKR